jgi:hypothetical protein
MGAGEQGSSQQLRQGAAENEEESSHERGREAAALVSWLAGSIG